jgi:hypothetical protein
MRSEISRLSHTEWRSGRGYKLRTVGHYYGMWMYVLVGRLSNATLSSLPPRLRPVRCSGWCMFTNEMNEKLERVLDVARHRFAGGGRELLRSSGVPNGVQNIDVRPALPPLRTGEGAGSAGVIIDGVGVVERACPSVFRLVADIYG